MFISLHWINLSADMIQLDVTISTSLYWMSRRRFCQLSTSLSLLLSYVGSLSTYIHIFVRVIYPHCLYQIQFPWLSNLIVNLYFPEKNRSNFDNTSCDTFSWFWLSARHQLYIYFENRTLNSDEFIYLEFTQTPKIPIPFVCSINWFFIIYLEHIYFLPYSP